MILKETSDMEVSSDDDSDSEKSNKHPYWITDKNIFKDNKDIEFLPNKEVVWIEINFKSV